MAKLKFKNSKGEWESIAAFQGEPGKDGAIQYTAGEGIKIENNIISADVTKQYVDDAVNNIDIPDNNTDFYYIDIEWKNYGEYGYIFTTTDYSPQTTLPTNILQSFVDYVNAHYDGSYFDKPLALRLNGSKITYCANISKGLVGGSNSSFEFLFFNPVSDGYIYDTPFIKNTTFEVSCIGRTAHQYTLDTNTTWHTGNRWRTRLVKDYLTKTNTTSFTPTADYHPATKKYVDDAIKTTLGGSY